MPALTMRGVLDETGLSSVIRSPFDVKLLYLQRFVRMFAFGAASLILALYLEELGYTDQVTGLFMALTMLGDVAISFLLTLFADGLGRRNVLVAGSALVAVCGVVFATSSSYWALLAAAIFGVISPSGNEIGPFRAIEESTLSSLAPAEISNSRSDIFAWHMLLGTLGAALGTAASGALVHALMHRYGFNAEESYRGIFWMYSGLGVVKLVFAACLSQRIEVDAKKDKGKQRAVTSAIDANRAADDERRPLLNSAETPTDPNPHLSNGSAATSSDKSTKISLIPRVSSESRQHLFKLIPLFALDSFASGLVPLSWLSPFFQEKYHLSHSALGTLFFSTNLVSTTSIMLSASLVRRAGLLYTMVLTHLPNDVFLALVPVPGPELAWLAITFLLLRNATSNMDSAPRQAFLTTLLDPTERTAVMGFVNVVKTVAQSAGPYVSGVLKDRSLLWLSFVLAGGLKVLYDLGVLVAFWKYRKNVKDRTSADADASDEEHEDSGPQRDDGGGQIEVVDEESRSSSRERRRDDDRQA